MLAKCLSNQSLDAISLHCPRQYPFARDNPKPGIFFSIEHKEDIVVFVSNLFCMHDMVESIRAQ